MSSDKYYGDYYQYDKSLATPEPGMSKFELYLTIITKFELQDYYSPTHGSVTKPNLQVSADKKKLTTSFTEGQIPNKDFVYVYRD